MRLLFDENTRGGLFYFFFFTVQRGRYVAVWCLSNVYSWGAPFPPAPTANANIRWGKTWLPGRLKTNHSHSENLFPSPKSPFPSPAPSLNLHYNKDKEGGGTTGLRWRGVKIGGVDGPGESDDLTAGQEKKAPSEQRTHKCVNDYVCVDLLCLYGGVGGKCICMWLHASGCCSFTNVYNKQMTPIS